jgi:hypothetical protein
MHQYAEVDPSPVVPEKLEDLSFYLVGDALRREPLLVSMRFAFHLYGYAPDDVRSFGASRDAIAVDEAIGDRSPIPLLDLPSEPRTRIEQALDRPHRTSLNIAHATSVT